ncbi:MAG TPA: hypothetical protein VIF82_14815 [Burkholderiaceae bacterium]|jgi:hypothetical protein
MKLNKLAVAVLVVATVSLSGCVVVPPRAYVAPAAVYVEPGHYGGYHHYHGYRD